MSHPAVRLSRRDHERGSAKNAPGREPPPASAAALLATFAASRFAMLFLVPTFLSDLGHYYELARRFASGLTPYQNFVFEYPPLALAPIYGPEFAQQLFQNSTFQGYMAAHWAMCFAFDAAIFAFAHRRARQGQASSLGLWAYAVGGLALAQLIYDRYDILMGAALFAAVASAGARRPLLSAASLAAGTFLKIVPAVFAPFFAVEAYRRERGNGRWTWLAAFTGFSAFGSIAFLWAFGSSIAMVFQYHSQRGIQVESFWATGQWLAHAIAPATFSMPALEFNFGAAHLAHASSLLDSVAALAPLVALAAVFAVYARKALVKSDAKSEAPQLGRALFIASLAIVSCGKVLSPQYLIWPLCLAPLAALDRRRFADVAFAAAFVAICALTAMEFRNYVGIIRMDDDVWVLVLVRNLALVFLAAAMAIDLARRRPLAHAKKDLESPSRARARTRSLSGPPQAKDTGA